MKEILDIGTVMLMSTAWDNDMPTGHAILIEH